jgi:hypothetical protein
MPWNSKSDQAVAVELAKSVLKVGASEQENSHQSVKLSSRASISGLRRPQLRWAVRDIKAKSNTVLPSPSVGVLASVRLVASEQSASESLSPQTADNLFTRLGDL